MIDLHTHILPGIDDGASDPDVSLEMLQMEADQDVDTVVLTPHFYREREKPSKFLKRRTYALAQLMGRLESCSEKQKEKLPRLLLGAEVAWVPNMMDWEELPDLCIQGTRNMLLELPMYPWNREMIRQIYDLMGQRGITPILVHLERYVKYQSAELLADLLSLGTPIQVNSTPMLYMTKRRPVMRLLKNGDATVMASDCHNLKQRPPTLRKGLQVVDKKLGHIMVEHLRYSAEQLCKATT